MHHSTIQRAERFPPILCRILARHKYGEPLTTLEISHGSGLPPATVEAISQSTSWEGIDIYQMQAFTSSCGVDFCNRDQMKRNEIYLRGGKVDGNRTPPAFAYLKRSPYWEAYFKPLLIRYFTSIAPPE